MRLYGACHRGEKTFLVMEHADNGTLRSFAAEHRHRTWAILHEVALGVQYLHERGIVHRMLTGDSIQIGDDGLVKLSAFGVFSGGCFGDATLEWDAPEVTFGHAVCSENDVYSLGMCIIEAVSGNSPYADEVETNQNIEELIKGGVPPKRPAAMNTRGWELVLQMICFEPRKRLKIPDVVRELAVLAQDEALDESSLVADPRTALDNNRDVEKLFARAHTLLAASDGDVGEEACDMETPQRHLYHRLYGVWQASEKLSSSSHKLVLPWLTDILARFTNELQTQALPTRAVSFAGQRQHADRVFSFLNEIDRLLEKHSMLLDSDAASTTTTSIHAWRGQ